MNLALSHFSHAGHLFSGWRRTPHSAAGRRILVVSDPGDAQDLHKNGTITVLRPASTEVECLQGCVWITQDGDPLDIVIDAGQRFRAERDTRMLIHALEPSRVRVVLPVR